MPLSDSDIFKAKIYKSKDTEEEKDKFIKSWLELSEKVNDVNENSKRAKLTLDALFHYYYHILRAQEENSDGARIALRKFYTSPNEKKKTRLEEEGLIEHIFPHKWQNTNYNGWNRKDAAEYLDKFGNKVAIEKRINIKLVTITSGGKRNSTKIQRLPTLRN